jgi:hypothetical protein
MTPPGYTRGQAGGKLLARIRAIVEEVLRRTRIQATQIDGQISLSQMPPGTTTINPDGSGGMAPQPHTWITDWNAAIEAALAAMLRAGTNVTITHDAVAHTFTIAATGGTTSSSGYHIVITGDGTVALRGDGSIVTAHD